MVSNELPHVVSDGIWAHIVPEQGKANLDAIDANHAWNHFEPKQPVLEKVPSG